VDDGESVDGTTFAFEDTMETLGEVHLDKFQRIGDMVTCEFEGSLDDLFGALGSYDGDGFGTSAEVHSGEESRQAEEMVAMEVRDKDGGERLKLDMATADAILRAFGAVEQKLEAANVDDLGTAATMTCGKGGAGTENCY
jgi:hypothetical protein